jgi:hypothetical protein
VVLRYLLFGAVIFGGAIAFGPHLGIRSSLAAFAGGLLLWTVLEYLIHRFAFHGFAPHWQHHAEPADPKYILAPIWLAGAGASLIWLLFFGLTGSAAFAALAISGVASGYLAYEWVHLRIHGTKAGGMVMRFLRKQHYYHHFADDTVCYGVTSPLWDCILRSWPEARSGRKSQETPQASPAKN